MAKGMRIESAADFVWALDLMEMARDTGEYGRLCVQGCYFLMADGGQIGFPGARANRSLILSCMDGEAAPEDKQWIPVAWERNDGDPLTCDETGESIIMHPAEEDSE